MTALGTLAAPVTRSARDSVETGLARLFADDAELARALDGDTAHQHATLALIASASAAPLSVLAAQATTLSNVTAEGYPGARYHSGAQWFDDVECLAVQRARSLFGARYANVQPHSCSSANLAVLAALVPPGGRVLAMDLAAGGHLTHGSPASVTGRHYAAAHYGVDGDGLLDYDEVARLAHRDRPHLIIAGASSYPRTIDFARLRAVADEVGAWLLADISHIAGLVATGQHPSPVDVAHVTTTSTYKQLQGPRGGLILAGAEADTAAGDRGTRLHEVLQRGVFPRTQGTPSPGAIAAKAHAFGLAAGAGFARTAQLIVADARALAAALRDRGHDVVTGGTDNHLVLLDLRASGLTGAHAERALEAHGILANRNRVPGDTSPALVTGGLRLGTNIVAQRGLTPADMPACAALIDDVVRAAAAAPDAPVRVAHVLAQVQRLCEDHPLYPDATP